MSSDYTFKFNKDRLKEIDEKIKQHKFFYKTEHNDYVYCINVDRNANGSWIYLDKSGTGCITRYAGTSPVNLNAGFQVLKEIVKAKSISGELW